MIRPYNVVAIRHYNHDPMIYGLSIIDKDLSSTVSYLPCMSTVSYQ